MDTPPVQYVTTSDGFSIAYTVSGAGVPLVWMPGPGNHLLTGPGTQAHVRWLTALSGRHRVIQYDGRGQGMSQRALSTDYDMDAPRRDLEAVIDRLELDRFVLFGSHASGHTAVRYAIANPGRVRALILGPCGTSGRSWALVAALHLARSNWEYFLSTWARGMESAGEGVGVLAQLKDSMTQEDWEIMATAWAASDIEELLPRLLTPTLLLHPHDYLNVPMEESRKLAAQIANARLAVPEGRSPLGDPVQGPNVIDEFLGSLPDLSQADRTKAAAVPPDDLSVREVEVLRLVAAGKSNAQIADELVISQNTVIRHVSNIFAKTGAGNRVEAAAYARDHGIS